MIKVNKFEAKTEEEALNKAMVELNCERANLFYKSEFVEGKLFKGSKYIVEVIEKSDVKPEDIFRMVEENVPVNKEALKIEKLDSSA